MNKRIILKRISLLNFKGVRNLEVSFSPELTVLRGANGTGKTTVFDAFTWLLFGKDSHDRKDFNVKTLDSDNKPIERIPHEVSACIGVGGEDVTLKKCYNENWVKKRGSAVETFNGHSVECYYNDVPCSVTEYARKVAEICDEQVFKLITSPMYFTAQKKDFQRAMLFRLAGDVTADDVLARHPEFSDLVAMLSGKTLEELKKEVACKKRKIKDATDTIPARIDERKRDMPEEQDWARLEADIRQGEEELAAIEALLADRSKVYEEVTKRKQETARQLSEARSKLSAREYEMKDGLLSDYHRVRREHEATVSRLSQLTNERHYKKISLQRAEKELEDLRAKREGLLSDWRSIKAETFSVDENSFVCPTCHRPLDADDIEAKRAKMEADFNANISRKLEHNKVCGMEAKAAIEAKQAEIDTIRNDIFKIDEETERIRSGKAYNEEPAVPDVAPAINADKTVIELRNKITDLQNQLDEEAKAPDTSDLKAQKQIIDGRISAAKVSLADRDRISANRRRIAELEREYSESQAQLADLEGVEYSIQQFGKARMEQVESRINGMFSIVRFKMFGQQINGGEIETCEATVGGVPYSDLNSAAQVNAGLDIINAISREGGVSAPVFIDNAESVSELLPIGSQCVRLVVDSRCPTLKTEYPETHNN